MHTMSLRLSDDQAQALRDVAGVEGLSMNEMVRQALVEAIAARRADPKFGERLERRRQRDAELYERLS